jgi:flagellar protein FlbT
MALKISLKPRERLIIGGAVIQNGGGRSDFLVENTVPILREKDILREQDADSPCKLVYFTIQLMYVDEKNLVDYHASYWKLVREIVDAAPGTLPIIDQISDHILNGRYYQALKAAQKLIDYEREAIGNVRKTVGSLSNRPKDHHVRKRD